VARIQIELCSKNSVDTKSYYYSRHSKSTNGLDPAAELDYSDDTYFFSRYGNSSDLLELELLMNHAANKRPLLCSVQTLFLLFSAFFLLI